MHIKLYHAQYNLMSNKITWPGNFDKVLEPYMLQQKWKVVQLPWSNSSLIVNILYHWWSTTHSILEHHICSLNCHCSRWYLSNSSYLSLCICNSSYLPTHMTGAWIGQTQKVTHILNHNAPFNVRFPILKQESLHTKLSVCKVFCTVGKSI